MEQRVSDSSAGSYRELFPLTTKYIFHRGSEDVDGKRLRRAPEAAGRVDRAGTSKSVGSTSSPAFSITNARRSFSETRRRCRPCLGRLINVMHCWTSSSLSSLWTVGLILCLLAGHCTPVVSSAPPTFAEFSLDHRRVFKGHSDGAPTCGFFYSLYADPENESQLYVGALDYVYRLNAANIQLQSQKTENLTNNADYANQYKASQDFCHRLGGLQQKDIQCRNHIRTVFPVANSDEIYVCSTGAYSPQEFYLNSDLKVVSVPLEPSPTGRAKCPYNPLSDYVFTYVVEGNPYNLPSIYTAVASDRNSANVGIFRPSMRYNRTSTEVVKMLRTDPDSKWINTAGAAYVVAVFDIDEYVYYFFRELALESTAYCGRTYYSRVARVCKKDEGGSGLNMEFRFTSFLKKKKVPTATLR